jgi:hypothetical protein
VLFVLMSAGVAHRPVLGLAGAVACAGMLLCRPQPERPAPPIWAAVVLLAFGTWYLVNAMAPEVEADPNTYHLTPAIAAMRHGGFPREITFYGAIPHATELLFALAFAFGGASAAKLVHLGFLLVSVPLIVSVARRFEVPEAAAWGAAVVYFAAPVVGVTSSSAFNDAALVAAILATAASVQTPAIAGLCTGFCFAIKMTGGIAYPIALIAFGVHRRWRDALVFTAAAALVATPWLLRNAVLTGNPFAPFFNAWFPNPYFTAQLEQELSASLRTYGVSLAERIPEVLWGSRLQGILGPVFLLSPLAILGLRRRPQRVLIALALVLTIPWWLNAGSRFLMPALPFVAMAMLAPLPRVAVIAIVALHAITAWPQAVSVYAPDTWHARRFPLAAALRIEPESAYLERTSWDYRAAKLIEKHTTLSDRILDLHGAHAAHIDRQLVGWWQSMTGRQAFLALQAAYIQAEVRLYETLAELPVQPLRRVRVRSPRHLSLAEVEFYEGALRHANRTQWSLYADKNRWELPLAFDRNLVTRWNAEVPLTVDFEADTRVSAIRVLATSTAIQVDVQRSDRTWTSLSAAHKLLGIADLRHEAIRALKRDGFTHIAAHAGYEGTGKIGYRLANDAPQWGIQLVDNLDILYLFRLP